MSKFVKRALKRVSWRADTPQYPLTTPESPTEATFGASADTHSRAGTPGLHNGFEFERPEEDVVKPITLAIIGGGQRGKASCSLGSSHHLLS